MNLLNTYITSDLHIGSNLIASTRGFDYWGKAWLDYKNHHNAIVKDSDNVIIAGDICAKKIHQELLLQLKGKLHFVLGNHDLDFNYGSYGYIYPMLLCSKTKVIVTHIPIHSCYFYNRKVNWTNLHGHLHDMYVVDENGCRDTRYVNVCPDIHKNKPILISSLLN